MKILKYFVVGCAAGLVDLSLFTLFSVFLGYNYFFVALFTFLIATGVNYKLSISHVFESGTRFTKHKEIFAVFFVSGVGLLINQGILYLSVEGFAISKFFAKIIASGLVFFWNFFIRHFYIFEPAEAIQSNSRD
jgi:putative flippase GtrA